MFNERVLPVSNISFKRIYTMNVTITKASVLLAVLLACSAALSAGETVELADDYLWRIGVSDNDTSEFALGPQGYAAGTVSPSSSSPSAPPDTEIAD